MAAPTIPRDTGDARLAGVSPELVRKAAGRDVVNADPNGQFRVARNRRATRMFHERRRRK